MTGDLAFVDEEDRGHALHLEAVGDLGQLVDVDLDQGEAVLVRPDDLLEGRGQLLTGAAPTKDKLVIVILTPHSSPGRWAWGTS